MLIDSTYFRNEIKLNIGTYSDIDQYITRYEKEVLTALLGYDLYKAFLAGLEDPSPLQKWLDLRDGVEYTQGDRTVKWNGLINSDKISLIAYYVYCKYLLTKQSVPAQAGVVQPVNENSTLVDGAVGYVQAWNAFVDLYGYSGQDVYEASALNYLSVHESDYDYHNKDFEKTNILGI